ncbi:hypothetical protein MBH78_14365 [Oceanimonas sp. NS1]|nr:hypothetical protein [Oceanimonas sp. NS1]
MKRIWISLFAAAGLYHGQATAATTMRVATWLSPSSEMNITVLPTWGKWIEEATEGRVKLKLEHDLGAPQSMIDLVQDGAVDASWTYHGYFPGRFKLTSIAELPNLGAGAEAASVAHWRIHEKYLSQANEHGEVVVAGLFTHGPGEIHTREPLAGLADLHGKKFVSAVAYKAVLASNWVSPAWPHLPPKSTKCSHKGWWTACSIP